MSIRMLRVFRVQCDTCCREHRTLDDYPTRTQALNQSVREGWVILNGKVLCPSCKSSSEVERRAPLFAPLHMEASHAPGRHLDAIC